NPLMIANVQQVLLQGDPAIRLVPFEQPDYQATAATVSFLPFDERLETIANPDSFDIAINVSNLGIIDTERRNFKLSVRRVFEDGTSVTYPSQSYQYIQKERELRFPVITAEENRERNQGQNFFEITIDSENDVEESNERNNVVTLNFTFGDRPLLTLFPSKYSIVNAPSPEITFIAQDPNADFEFAQYVFQMDTTALFDSPVLREQVLSSNEQIISWRTSLSVPTDETVHYWRVRRVNEELDTVWSEASFVYAPTSNEGWNQSHPFQFREAELNTISLDQSSRLWEFDTYKRDINFSANVVSNNEFDYKIAVDGIPIVENNCGNTDDAVIVTVFDQFSGQVIRPRRGGECGNSLSSARFVRGNLTPYIDTVKTGDWVILASFAQLVSGSSRGIFADAAERIGADPAILNANLRRRAVVIGQKGAAAGTAIMVFEDPDDRNVISDTTVQISGFYNTGEILSTRIGPAVNWKELTRTVEGQDAEDKGWELDVLLEFENGSQSVLLEDVQEEITDLSAISTVGADFLRLRLRTEDKTSDAPDPNQLEKWRVTYTEVPEGILLYDSASYRPNTTLEVQEGDPVVLAFEFENISGSDFTEPLQVSYEIQNLSSGIVTNLRDTLAVLAGNSKIKFETNFNSVDFFGENQVLVTVNPRLQLEQRYDNNTLTARFLVKPDDINPVLDVAFDGKHILNGDLVAPSPLISVSLQDENRAQIRQDTTGIDLLLKPADCEGCIAERINFSDPRLTWQTTENNRIEITYQPDPLADGLYNFTVRAADVRGNQSGVQPYSVNFEVVNESAITHFYPHPNPFSSQMRFVFTLTGQEIPEDIRIQIMTISGKLVKTIHKEDLGPLRIGDNITDFAWDGTDEFGDQLANGVYLYKVFLRDNSTDFEHRETSNDGLFKQNIGKIYLMR
ncbi:MAG: CARDB domain-containing protein, partial [Bacteroidota bacterium]